MRTDESGNSARLAMWYRDRPLSLEMMKTFEGSVTKQCWKYLLGKLYTSERNKRSEDESMDDIKRHLGDTFGYASASIKNFAAFSKGIDKIARILPNIAADILNDKTRLSEKDIYSMLKMTPKEIERIIERINIEKMPAKFIIAEQNTLGTNPKRPGRPKLIKSEVPRASVKDNPSYNPDAQLNALTYTIPSWVSMIEQTFSSSDFALVSSGARDRLTDELNKLIDAASTMTALIAEEA